MKPEDHQIGRFCIRHGYLTTKQLQILYERMKALEGQGSKKRLIELIAEALRWSREEALRVYRAALSEREDAHPAPGVPDGVAEIQKPAPALGPDPENGPGPAPERLAEDLLFARELLIRGGATLDDINDCLKDVKPGESTLLQILLRKHKIKLADVIRIKSDLQSWSPEELKERHHKGPAISVSWDGNRIALAQKSGFQKIGAYEILRELGRGGMGVVYAARDERLSRAVALKIAISREQDAPDAERFRREVRMAASLSHPNIVAVHEVGEHEGLPFFTMELIEGLPLAEYVQKVKPDSNGVARILRDVADALGFAHSKNVVHRDVKPANILVDMDGKPHLTDFGLARNIQGGRELTVSGEILGTPAYMSPEQANGRQEIGQGSDVYSFGAAMYELLVGRPPFTESSMVKLIVAISEQDPIAPRKQNKGIPKDLEVICLKCLEKKPARRYAGGREVAADLERYLKGRPIQARPASILYQTGKWLWRNKAVSAAVLALVLLSLSAWAWGKAARSSEALRLVRETGEFLAKVPGAAALEKKYPGADALLPPEAEREIEKSLQEYMRAWRLLEEAGKLAPSDLNIQKRLYQIQKEIGSLSLLGRNYLISQVFFTRCRDINLQEAEKLLQRVETRRKELVESQIARVEEIMKEVAAGPPQEGMVDEYVTEIVRMKGSHTSAKLLSYLDSPHEWQRRVSVEALGKLGDRSAKMGDKDVVEWLLQRLATLDLQKDEAEMEEMVWALGRLRDARANSLVYKIRWDAGENGIFWDKTMLPYRWLPLQDEGKGEDTDSPISICKRGIMKYQKGDLDGAIADFNHAIHRDPRFVGAYNNLGLARQAKGDLDGAIADFNQAIQRDPRSAEAYTNRGIARRAKGELDGAVEDFNQAIQLNPRLAEAYTNRGNARQAEGDLDGAIEDYNQVIQLNPRNVLVYTNRGAARQAKGDLDGAIEDYSHAIQFNPRAAEAYTNRGIARKAKGDLDGAIADFNQAIQLNPRLAEAYTNRGLARQAKEDLDGAIADHNHAIRLNPQAAEAYTNRGNARQAKGDLDGAIADYNQAIQLDPRLAETYGNRGLARQAKGDLDGAIADYNQVIQLNPNFAPVYKIRANLYKQKGLHQKAVADYRAYLKLCPNDPEATQIQEYIRRKGD